VGGAWWMVVFEGLYTRVLVVDRVV
jgi:hypothetical protein